MNTLLNLNNKEDKLTYAINVLTKVRYSDKKTFTNALKEVTKARKEVEQAKEIWIGSLGE